VHRGQVNDVITIFASGPAPVLLRY